jgi:putative membrane protein
MSKLARLLLLLLGMGLLAFIVTRVDLATVGMYMGEMGWAFPLIFVPYIVVYLCDTLGWKFAFGPATTIPFHTLFLTRMAGESINNLTPFAYLGGEPVKAHLLTRFHIPMVEGMAAAIMAKLLMSIAQFAFVVLGGILAMSHLVARPDVLWTLVVVVLTGGVVLGALICGLQRGLFTQIYRLLDRWNLTPSVMERWRHHLRHLDETIVQFYRRHPRYLALSLLWHFIGWMVGSLEVLALFYAVDLPIQLSEALAIEALASVAKGVAFFIPGSLGVQEGGNVLIIALFGFPSSLGLTFSLVRRMRELLWISMGLLVLLRHYGWHSQLA